MFLQNFKLTHWLLNLSHEQEPAIETRVACSKFSLHSKRTRMLSFRHKNNNKQKTTKEHKQQKQETAETGEKHHSRSIFGKRPTSRDRGLQPRWALIFCQSRTVMHPSMSVPPQCSQPSGSSLFLLFWRSAQMHQLSQFLQDTLSSKWNLWVFLHLLSCNSKGALCRLVRSTCCPIF